MLKVDLVKKVVYECRGIDAARLPSRCKVISDVSEYAAKKFRFFDLSEWMIVDDNVAVGDRTFRSRADAEYEIRKRGLNAARVVRVADNLELV